MSSDTTVWLCDAQGDKLYPFEGEYDALNYTKVVNGAGKLHSFGAAADELARDLVQKDRQLQVWRRPAGGAIYLDFVALLRHWRWVLAGDGGIRLIVEDNDDQNGILKRRKVAYKSGTAQAIANTEAADNAMKRIFNENFLAGVTDSDRSLAHLLTKEADKTAGPNISKAFSFDTVLEVFQEISQETRQAGNEVFFALAIREVDRNTGRLSFQFRTYTGQPGADRTHDTLNPVIFSPQHGNIEEMELVYDHRGEENAIYVAGNGVGERRTVVEVEDVAAQGASIWNRCEGFVDARDAENTAQDLAVGVEELLQARGQQRINETRPTMRLNGRVRSTEYSLYGRDWFVGDRVTVNALAVQFDALIRAANVNIQRGSERIISLVEAEL